MKRAFLALAATFLMLGGCQTLPDQPTISAVEKGARGAELGYVAGVQIGYTMVYAGGMEKSKFKELDFKAYTALTVTRLAFASVEPASALKPDYLALVDRSDDQHLEVVGF